MPESFVTPFFRLSFPELFTAKPVNKHNPESAKKFGIQMIWIDQRPIYAACGREELIVSPSGTPETELQKDYAKDPTLLIQVRRQLVLAAKEKWTDDVSKWPMPFKGYDLSTYVSEDGKKWPIRNGDFVAWAGFQGHLFSSAKANEDRNPGIARANPKDQRPVAPSEVFGGLICRANLNAYCWYNAEGGHGVSLGLNHVQIIMDDGVRFGGSAGPVEEAFGAWDDGSMDPDNFKTPAEGVTTANDF